ncbi:NAD(P)H-dependent oxidoreductase [Spirochaetia bacterium 38H-sp]|uniref:NAD(P)H-dependent oxidoreductase n=1 Tax=Rarispira pelagica TaxID=3141764 RepID=A0ABU9UCT1_9SPIR
MLILLFVKVVIVVRQRGGCIYRADIEELEHKLAGSDILIFGSPTNWANMSSLMLNFFERLFGFLIKERDGAPPLKNLPGGRMVVLITACYTPFPFNLFF